ncbi:hypothetical protein PPYR_08628 [Photinus pyralis]|uniref:Carboxylic ester hydrolase n=2 Tax=Photinus pyralis TaxID=7054 RepID=A0A1Y1KW32_PHOPY|nr:venom carboxylesterase-6-like isoform X2 [Photinus pyralis]KAB0797635.1 hypothetical protein PPYR_08628 [Photinus pyralis]
MVQQQVRSTNIFFVILVLEVLVIHGSHSSPNDSLVVTTNYGKLKGTLESSRSNRSFCAFKGIPYAKPPVGNLRFRAPVAPDSWTNVRDASKDASMCIQKNYLFYENPPVEGKEDCLYLNVYTPQCARTSVFQSRRTLLPVMVFIHYGAFFGGTGRSDYLGPEFFMDRKVVLVTFNYRLGAFGFLSTNDDASPGNWGLKDQVAALQWVHENIIFFGGNNQKVTIFGQSAGAGSVHYHMLSPTTKHLFSKAISQSGSTLSLWGRPANELQAQIAKQQATFVGCDAGTDSNTMVSCLRNVDAEKLADSVEKFKYFSSEPFLLYAPVTERRTALNPKPYITEDPLDIIKSGRMRKVPWILGVVADEGILRASPLLRQSSVLSELNSNFLVLAPQMFALSLSIPDDNVKNVLNKINDFYIGTNFINITQPESVQGFIDLYSDRSFVYGSYQSALLHAWKGHTPIWFYNFAYKGQNSYEPNFAATNEEIPFKWGISHCDDLIYLFPSKRFFPRLSAPHDQQMSKIMIKMWVNFATYGDPTPLSDPGASRWRSLQNLEGRSTVRNSDLIYLNISGSFKNGIRDGIRFEIMNSFYPERMRFWQSLPLWENIDGLQ